MEPVVISEEYLRPRLLVRENDSHKGDYGHLLLVCGSQSMPGAAVLATGAALRSGCGLVTLHSTARALQAVVNCYPSAILSEDPDRNFSTLPASLEKYSAIAVGPGLGQSHETLEALSRLLFSAKRTGIPMVLDADALNLLAAHPALWNELPPGSILTPHLGELQRIVSWNSEVERDVAVRQLCLKTGSTLVMKGYHSRVYLPDGECLANTTGNPGMAKGGSGDVLTGLVGGLLARGYDSSDAAALGVWIHGYAGDRLTADRTAEAYDSSDLVDNLWTGFKHLYMT